MSHPNAPQIIEAFGGIGATARRLGIPKSTVASWARGKKKSVPAWRMPMIEEAAAKDGIRLPRKRAA